MRLYIICPLLLVLGCAATEPQASIRLKDPKQNIIKLCQVKNSTFKSCEDSEIMLRTNAPDFWIDTKIVSNKDDDIFDEEPTWKLSLVPCGEKPVYREVSEPLVIDAVHPKGDEKCLSLNLQIGNVKLHNKAYGTPIHIADLYVTICPPIELSKR